MFVSEIKISTLVYGFFPLKKKAQVKTNKGEDEKNLSIKVPIGVIFLLYTLKHLFSLFIKYSYLDPFMVAEPCC